MPTKAEIVNQIEEQIIPNLMELITGGILQNVLLGMVDQINTLVGELDDLNTDDRSSIVNAINELVVNIQAIEDNLTPYVYFGIDDPNIVTPVGFGGDIPSFYVQQMHVGIDVENIALWTYTGVPGSEWINLMVGGSGGIQSIQAGTNVTIDNTDPLNPIISSESGEQDNIFKVVSVSLSTLDMDASNTDEEIKEALAEYIESLELNISETEIYIYQVTGFPETYKVTSGGSGEDEAKDINMSWGAIGHSIWASDGSLNGIQTLVRAKFNFTSYNKYAYSGHSLSSSSISNSNCILNPDKTDLWTYKDIYTYDSITNDFKLNRPIGTTDDFLNDTGVATYYGALRVLHDTLKGLNPSYLMICANALKRDNASYTSWSTNTQGHSLSDYSTALEWVANRLSWRFINQFRDSGINDENLSTYTSDGLHPNNDGYKRYADLWIAEFNKIYNGNS